MVFMLSWPPMRLIWPLPFVNLLDLESWLIHRVYVDLGLQCRLFWHWLSKRYKLTSCSDLYDLDHWMRCILTLSLMSFIFNLTFLWDLIWLYSSQIWLYSSQIWLYSSQIWLYSSKIWLHSSQIWLYSSKIWLHLAQIWLYSAQIWLYSSKIWLHSSQIWLYSSKIWLHLAQIWLYSAQIWLYSSKIWLYSAQIWLYSAQIWLYSAQIWLYWAQILNNLAWNAIISLNDIISKYLPCYQDRYFHISLEIIATRHIKDHHKGLVLGLLALVWVDNDPLTGLSSSITTHS